MLNHFISWLFNQSRSIKRIISVIMDSFFIILAFWGAIGLRLESLEPLTSIKYWVIVALFLPISLFAFMRLGLYRAVLRYMGNQAVGTMLMGISISVAAMVFMANALQLDLPRSIPIIYAALAILLCGGARIMVRALYSQSTQRHKVPVIIYGAGEAGRQLASSLQHGREYKVVAFIDDDRQLHKTLVQGIKIYSLAELQPLVEQFDVKKLLLAMPSIPRHRKQAIIEALQGLSLELLSIPGMADLVEGRASISHLKEVSIEDLLGREPVEPFSELMAANITAKVVMVTGAGGSIGSELCRQIIQQQPALLVLYESSEYALYQIDHELQQLKSTVRVVPILASVLDEARLEAVMSRFNVQTVYHAAAYKHVPLVEFNVVEGVRNNVFGTLRTAEAAIYSQVETFVLISTDKAVRPTNVMGATKRVAELVLQALAKQHTSTRFCMVRFGNVLGSSGSVVPLFKKQIAAGGPITVTDERITRYFMTMTEAAQLVIQAGAMGKGGDVFVLDMGNPVPIIELARKMVNLMGLKVKEDRLSEGDIEIQITGLRPGEKLYEELLVSDQEAHTEHPRIRTANEACLSWQELTQTLNQLELACLGYDQAKIRQLLLTLPLAFSPKDGIADLVWLETNPILPRNNASSSAETQRRRDVEIAMG